MQKILTAAFGFVALGSLAMAQSQPPYPPPVYQQAPPPAYPQNYPAQGYPTQGYPNQGYPAQRPLAGQVTPQILGEMLRSAATFNELVRNMNLNRTLGPDVHAIGPNGRPIHSVERTAETIGAGAGAGAALGAMSRNPNGVMIGALIGGAGGLIIDQVLRHQEEVREHAFVAGANDPRAFRERAPERR